MAEIDVQERDRWVEDVATVLREVEAWALRHGWATEHDEQEIEEEPLGIYRAPVLTVRSPGAKLILEPVARFAVGSDGRIDAYAWPSLRRLLLKRKSGSWRLETEAGIPWPRPWSEAAFEELVKLLGEAA